MEVSGLSMELRYTILIFWVVFFAFAFRWSWALFDSFWPRFRTYSFNKQADNSSRVTSTIHSIIVAPCLLYGVSTMSWSGSLEAQASSSFLQATLLVSAGYFISDIYIVLYYRIPMWTIFMLHHIAAMVPYLLYYFTCCNYGLYILSVYMLVEITNVPFNTMQWMQETGNTDGLLYPFLLHLTAAMWIVFRIASPLRCLFVTYQLYLPAVKYPPCLWPAQVCGVLVNIFCFAGFFVVIANQLAAYWSRPAKNAAKKERRYPRDTQTKKEAKQKKNHDSGNDRKDHHE
jgi:hypothetical protein